MHYTKHLLKIVTLAFILLAAAVVIFLIFRPSPTPKEEPTPDQGQSQNSPKNFKSLQPQEISGDGFSYNKPEGWAKLSKELLDSSAATSGIGLLPTSGSSMLPVATFMIKVSSSIPKNDTDLKNSVTAELKKQSNLAISSTTAVKVNDKPGYRFAYRYGDKEKTQQELNVIIHNKKTFFILSSTAEADFSKHTEAFTTILNSFTFK